MSLGLGVDVNKSRAQPARHAVSTEQGKPSHGPTGEPTSYYLIEEREAVGACEAPGHIATYYDISIIAH